jgi:hypothetical protein
MSDFWQPPNNPYSNIGLPSWKKERKRSYKLQFLLNNLDQLLKPPPPSNPLPLVQTEAKETALSGHKRKAIKLETDQETNIEDSCEHPVWHSSFPYCSICVDLSKVKIEDPTGDILYLKKNLFILFTNNIAT